MCCPPRFQATLRRCSFFEQVTGELDALNPNCSSEKFRRCSYAAAAVNKLHELQLVLLPKKFVSAGKLWNNSRFAELAPSTEKRIIIRSSILLAFGRKPGGINKAFGLGPHLSFTWAQAFGYPLEEAKAGGQRVRLKYSKLFHDGSYGTPLANDAGVDAALATKGMIQEQAPLPGRFEEVDKLAATFSRDAGVVSWPEKEVRRLMADEDWDFGPNIRARAEAVLAAGGLPEYPAEMRETFEKIMNEHGLDTSKYLS